MRLWNSLMRSALSSIHLKAVFLGSVSFVKTVHILYDAEVL